MNAANSSLLKGSYRFSWVLIAYTVLVIAWGAWVRLSGSGDGCGDDWPRCNGAVVPLDASIQTLIEYSHRISTAVYGILVLIQILLARKSFAKGSRCRFWAWMTLLFTVTEALIGRSLVKQGLVNQSTDVSRLVVMPLHLINTSMLLFSCVMTAESFKFGDRNTGGLSPQIKRKIGAVVVVLAMIITSGAIAALGSHLAPSSSLLAGFSKDLAQESHAAVRLRIIHPMLALAAAGALIITLSAGSSRSLPIAYRWIRLFSITFFIAIGVGILTLGLLSPLWLKVTHLVMANALVIVASLCVFHTVCPTDTTNQGNTH
jgi:heme A synthase